MPENKDDIDLEGWDLDGAARENRVDVARALIARGDDVDARDEDGWTPLHWAAEGDSLDVARLLIVRGAEVDARDKYGDTPLHRVVQKDSLSVGKLLITNGADIDAMNRYGHTPRHWVLGSSEELSVDSPLTDSHSANTDGLVLSRIDDQEDA